MYVYTCVYICIFMYIYVFVCIFIYIYMYIHIHIYMYICIGANMFVEFMNEMKNPKDFWKSQLLAQIIIMFCYILYGSLLYHYQGQYVANPGNQVCIYVYIDIYIYVCIDMYVDVYMYTIHIYTYV
jgi:hypothetical protein